MVFCNLLSSKSLSDCPCRTSKFCRLDPEWQYWYFIFIFFLTPRYSDTSEADDEEYNSDRNLNMSVEEEDEPTIMMC